MKALNQYITEKFQVGKDYKRQYAYHPKDTDELISCIKDKIEKEGLGTEENPLDLNDIDTSKITDMYELFDVVDGELQYLSKNGHFDISDWDVSNVENMEYMFGNSNFDGDLSDWDVSSVTNMKSMFRYSEFTGKNGDIGHWNVSNVKSMRNMFGGSRFDGDISNWDVSNVENKLFMLDNCPLQKHPPKWYKK